MFAFTGYKTLKSTKRVVLEILKTYNQFVTLNKQNGEVFKEKFLTWAMYSPWVCNNKTDHSYSPESMLIIPQEESWSKIFTNQNT